MTTFYNHSLPKPDSYQTMQGITHEIVYLSSEDAANWLVIHKGPNRRISDAQVLRFQSDMESGRWHFEGAP
jgi:hypothetical protein